MDTLRDKKCIITGAASGIGRATALAAAAAGAELFFIDVNAELLDRMSDRLDRVARAAPALPGSAPVEDSALIEERA